MTFRELKITENPDGTKTVDFWPGMFVKPTHEKEPTMKDPNITADLGRVGGKMSPVKAYYPEYVDTEEIVASANSVEKKDSLFSKTDHCPMCERKKREIVHRLRSAMRRGRDKEESVRNMVEESKKIKTELSEEGYELDSYEEAAPPPLLPPAVERSLEGREEEIQESENQYKTTMESINTAAEEVQKTILQIIRGPSEIRLPR